MLSYLYVTGMGMKGQCLTLLPVVGIVIVELPIHFSVSEVLHLRSYDCCFFVLFVFEMGPHYVALTGLELAV